MKSERATILLQIDQVLEKLKVTEKANTRVGESMFAPISDTEIGKLTALVTHALERFRPPMATNAYGDETLKRRPYQEESDHLKRLGGILSALRDDYANDRLQSLRELVHADLFADFLEMADHLHEEGYKDAAAVTAGSVLEEHIRKLCVLHSVPTTFTDAKGDVRPKKLDTMNADLSRQPPGAYSLIEQKEVTSWAAIRNAAAHGEYSKYTKEQVRLLIDGVRSFIIRHPA